MVEHTPAASQESVPSITADSTIVSDFDSPPVLPNLDKPKPTKPRRPPTITPRSFTRFFTPKSSLEKDGRYGASRQALREITTSAVNRRARRSPGKDAILICEDVCPEAKRGEKRKRRTPYSQDTPPDLSSPLKRIRNHSLELSEEDNSEDGAVEISNLVQKVCGAHTSRRARRQRVSSPILESKHFNLLGSDLQREIGGQVHKRGVFNASHDSCFSRTWQYQTTKFVTEPEDTYVSINVTAPSDYTIPFCSASCNTNSLVAIGDEDGGIRLLESAKDENPGFSNAYLKFRPHSNAILDLAFSPDDMLLATASGDQTSQVIEMLTQRATYTMAGHVSSVKQVCFQPGSSSVIATSSRDGSVQIWDLRCKGLNASVRDIKVSLDPNATRTSNNYRMTWARSVNTVPEAHASRRPMTSPAAPVNASKATQSYDASSKTELPGRRSDVSITGLSFLNPGREHLLITASEANASVKLWDLRTSHNHRRGWATPLSSTQQPDSHNKHRQFGLTSLSLSGDGARLYTLCRDNTVYAYSTSHLILGHAPELSSTSPSKPRRSGGPEKDGLGPIYGLRHPSFHATTFYVKSAIRSAQRDQTELLAVGSSDGTPVLFPTDERYIVRSSQPKSHFEDLPIPRPQLRQALAKTNSGTGLLSRLEDRIPIYQHGSALVRGHGREVTGLTWTNRGELITVSDDFSVRCWRESDKARSLRVGGEGEGRRWGYGWAEASDGWDDDDDDDNGGR